MVRNMDNWDKEWEIIQSWHQNDAVWTTAVRQQQIESRVLATNQAIIDAVASKRPASDLRSLLMEVYRDRAAAVKEADIREHAARDRLMAPSTALST